MPFGDDAERTEAATPRRREKAREAGQAVKSREVVITAVFLSNVLFFSFAGTALYEHMLTLTREAFVTVGEVEFSLAGMQHLYTRYLTHLATMLLPLLLTTFALTLGCHLLADWISFFTEFSRTTVVTYQSGTRFAAFILHAGTKRID